MILTRCVVPTSAERSPPFGTPLSDAGINTRTPNSEIKTPPLTASTILPSSVSSFSFASTICFQFLSESTRFLDSMAMPSRSLTLITNPSTSSPILNSLFRSTPASSVIWSYVITPVAFVPRSRRISLFETDITVPTTVSPVFKVLNEESSSCSKFSASVFMVLYTSSIIPRGVEAPAVIPICWHPEKTSGSSSAAHSINTQFSHREDAISNSFFVFELSFPPITIIPSH